MQYANLWPLASRQLNYSALLAPQIPVGSAAFRHLLNRGNLQLSHEISTNVVASVQIFI